MAERNLSNDQIKSILFFKTLDSSFILKDEDYLRSHLQVYSFKFKQRKNLLIIGKYFKQIAFILWNIKKASTVFIWFADYHSFLPILFAKIFKKKSLLVLGGGDTIYIKDYNYGVFTNKVRSFCARFSIENASVLLPVDKSLIERVKPYIGKIKGDIVVLPTGYNLNNWFCDTPKEDIVMTVAKFNTWSRLMIKGIDRFVELAKKTPKLKFQLIGVTDKNKELLEIFNLPENLECIQPLHPDELRIYYSKAKYYAQLSRSEGLPNAVCEAMLCKCIPICTDVGGVKDLIGPLGYLIKLKDLNHKFDHFEIPNEDHYNLHSIRKRIIDKYSNRHREKKLFEIICTSGYLM